MRSYIHTVSASHTGKNTPTQTLIQDGNKKASYLFLNLTTRAVNRILSSFTPCLGLFHAFYFLPAFISLFVHRYYNSNNRKFVSVAAPVHAHVCVQRQFMPMCVREFVCLWQRQFMPMCVREFVSVAAPVHAHVCERVCVCVQRQFMPMCVREFVCVCSASSCPCV